MSPAARRAPRSDVESAIMDAMCDVRILDIVLEEASDSPREDRERPLIIMEEATFLAWQRACSHLVDSVRETERVFYETDTSGAS